MLRKAHRLVRNVVQFAFFLFTCITCLHARSGRRCSNRMGCPSHVKGCVDRLRPCTSLEIFTCDGHPVRFEKGPGLCAWTRVTLTFSGRVAVPWHTRTPPWHSRRSLQAAHGDTRAVQDPQGCVGTMWVVREPTPAPNSCDGIGGC